MIRVGLATNLYQKAVLRFRMLKIRIRVRPLTKCGPGFQGLGSDFFYPDSDPDPDPDPDQLKKRIRIRP